MLSPLFKDARVRSAFSVASGVLLLIAAAVLAGTASSRMS
jgi:hypothetical protein